MKKPKAPKKPLKNAPPPERKASKELIIMQNYDTKELVLVTPEYHDTYNEEERCMQWEIDNLWNLHRMVYSQILIIREKLKIAHPEVEDFEISFGTNGDHCVDGCMIDFEVFKSDEEYAAELKAYENRWDDYEKARMKYEEELKEYEKWKIQNRKEKLQKQLAELEK